MILYWITEIIIIIGAIEELKNKGYKKCKIDKIEKVGIKYHIIQLLIISIIPILNLVVYIYNILNLISSMRKVAIYMKEIGLYKKINENK